MQECAAVAVPSKWGEDEVMIVVAPKPGATIEPADLLNFLITRMAHFMVPRYIRLVDELPKTPTSKIQKAGLRKEGITADTWDREAAGVFRIEVRAGRVRCFIYRASGEPQFGRCE